MNLLQVLNVRVSAPKLVVDLIVFGIEDQFFAVFFLRLTLRAIILNGHDSLLLIRLLLFRIVKRWAGLGSLRVLVVAMANHAAATFSCMVLTLVHAVVVLGLLMQVVD